MITQVKFAAALLALTIEGCATHGTTAQHPAPAKDPACVTTASRIPADSACSSSGRSYSNEDLERTGKISAAEALRQLDPSITGH
jgi:hypothetical protein